MPAAAYDLALCDALAEILSDPARGFSRAFNCESLLVPDWDERKELATTTVALLPGLNPTAGLGERGGNSLDRWPVELFVAQRLTAKTRDELAALLRFVDELLDYLFPRNGSGVGKVIADDNGQTWQCVGWEARGRFDPQSLTREKHGDAVTYTGAFFSATTVYWRRLT
jgi:hypothetical protein